MAVRIENSLEDGMPDVVVTHEGYTVFIELKASLRNSKKQTNQIDWARRWNKAGGTSYFLVAMDDGLFFIPGHLYKPDADLSRWRIKNYREVFEIISYSRSTQK